MDAGTRNVYSNKPITKPPDLKGQKMRTMGNPQVVDGAENNPPSMLTANHYQIVKVYSLTGHLIIPEMFVFSKASWDKLSKEDQALIRKHSREVQMEQRVLWDKYVGEAEAKLKAAGVQFVPADKAAFFKATQPIRDKYGAKYAALQKRILDTK